MDQAGITRVSFAEDPIPENLCLALIEPNTKERAHLAALDAIATPATVERRDILLGRAKAMTVIASDGEVKTATEIAGLLKGLRNDVESARHRIKKPVITIGKAIDAVAAELAGEAVNEILRLERLMGNFAAEKERQRQEDNRRRAEEVRRAQEAADREAVQAREAEDNRRREADELTAKAEAGEVDLFAALDAETRADEAASVAASATAQAAAPIYASIVTAAPKFAGAAVAKDWDFEVIDIVALYASNPSCVELKEHRGAIKAAIQSAAQQAGGKTFTIPGLRISPKFNITTRAR